MCALLLWQEKNLKTTYIYICRLSKAERGGQFSEDVWFDQQRGSLRFGQTRQRVGNSGGKFTLWISGTRRIYQDLCACDCVPLAKCGVVIYSQVSQDPRALCPNIIPKSLLCSRRVPSSPVGVFDYFFKWIWIITADCPWVGIVIDIC